MNSGIFSYFETGMCFKPTYKVPEPAILELGENASTYIFLLIGILTSFIVMVIELLVKRFVGEKEAKVGIWKDYFTFIYFTCS